MTETVQTETVQTMAALLANLETALNTLMDQQGGAATSEVSAQLEQFKTLLVGDAAVGSPETHQTLGALQDLVYNHRAALQISFNGLDNDLQAVRDQLTALDETYATDSELAERIQAMNTAMAAADDDLVALVNGRITTDAATALVDDAKVEMQAYADQVAATLLNGITEMINARIAAGASSD